MDIKRQRGMSMLGMLATTILVASIMLLAMKVIPMYINDFSVGKAVASLEEDRDLYSRTKYEIRKIILKKLKVDYADGLEPENIQVEKKKGIIVVDVNYEARTSVIANLEIVAKFSHHLEKNK